MGTPKLVTELSDAIRGLAWPILLGTIACLLAPPLFYLYRYRNAIKKRVKEIEKNVSLVRVARNTKKDISKNRVVCMELDPDFVKANSGWQMMSFGEYLSQLEPANGGAAFNQLFLQKELEITLGEFLLRTLGKSYGAALLPMMGAASVAASIGGVSTKLSKFFAKCILSDEADAIDPLDFDLSLMEVISFANVNQKYAAQGNGPINPLEYLSRGEKAAGDLSYDLGADGAHQFPNTFDLSDFNKYVKLMEDRILEKEETYDPDDRSFPPSTPFNERLLPGLHLGKGDLKYTHTKKEGIEHRLLCVLLNKLSYNYYKRTQSDNAVEDCFTVICEGKTCVFPEELIQGLVDMGHKVEVCPRAMVTNFGLQCCVKEEDGSFTYIPSALMLRTGIERTSDSKPAYFAAPHGGMDLNISGPLVGKGTRPAWIQFYVSIGGLTCFHPDEDQDGPWAAKTSLAEIYSHDDAIRAIRMCAVVAIVFNRIATDFNLPFGGYGILGMCNDSSTLVDLALRGETQSYPLLSTGRYLYHIVSYLDKTKTELSERSMDMLKPVIGDISCLIKSGSTLPSDLHISPSTLIGTSERYESSYLVSIFQGTTDAKEILSELAEKARGYLELGE